VFRIDAGTSIYRKRIIVLAIIGVLAAAWYTYRPSTIEESPTTIEIPDRKPPAFKLSTTEIAAFKRRTKQRLRSFEAEFKRASSGGVFDWRLLAAISYQESQWNPAAKSTTGVQGLMMLTRVTAETVGVSDRRDPKQSIHGGAKHLDWIFDNLPDDVSRQTARSFALAAYNVGLSRVKMAWWKSGVAEWGDFVKYIGLESGSPCIEIQRSNCSALRAAIKYSRRVEAFRELL
jgi:membrane-bound lytic murein transglycosylase MltF